MADDDADDRRGIRMVEAYRNEAFLDSSDARSLRILSEFLEPQARFRNWDVSDTIVFFGSSRMYPQDVADRRLAAVKAHGGDLAGAERDAANAHYYEEARELSRRLTEWSKGLPSRERRFVICTGGGPGLMEAANRGASEARGINVGLNITLEHEQEPNPYITRGLGFEFHYFFMRKFWFVYLAKAVIIFPGGFGTLDEFFELMTLNQTKKLKKQIPIVLYGSAYWDRVLNFDAMVEAGTIEATDLDMVFRTDDVDAAYDFLVRELTSWALDLPGGFI